MAATPTSTHNKRAVYNDLPLEEKVLQKLISLMYYCPIANGQKILRHLLDRVIFKDYQLLLDKTDYIFEQHSGAVITVACFLIALERCVATSITDSDRRYFNKQLKPISRLFTVSGGRPNIDVRVKFNVGNTNNPAFGYLPGSEGKEEEEMAPPNNGVSLYGGILSSGPSVRAHHVIVHGSKMNDTPNFFPRLLIKAKSFPSQNRRQREDVFSRIINTQLYCNLEVFNNNFTDASMLQKYIKIDPLPFLINVILRNSAV